MERTDKCWQKKRKNTSILKYFSVAGNEMMVVLDVIRFNSYWSTNNWDKTLIHLHHIILNSATYTVRTKPGIPSSYKVIIPLLWRETWWRNEVISTVFIHKHIFHWLVNGTKDNRVVQETRFPPLTLGRELCGKHAGGMISQSERIYCHRLHAKH